MPWIDKIRAKPHHEKIRFIWILSVIAALILLALWILIGGAKKNSSPDTSVWQTLVQGGKNFSNQVKNLKR